MKKDNCSKAVFEAALRAWNEGAELRRRRERMKAYCYGRQWDDPCRLPDGTMGTEADRARLSGRNPLTNNLLRQLVKSVVGRFRSMRAEERRGDTPALAALRERNLLDELDARMLEEFLISGCAVQRVVRERRPAGDGVWVDNVSPARFFINRYLDPRGTDIELVGMVSDMSLNEAKMRFGGGSAARCAEIERVYRRLPGEGLFGPDFGAAGPSTFLEGTEAGRCRVVEVWTLETREVIKCHDAESRRLFMVDVSEAAALGREGRRRRREGLGAIESRRAMTVRWRGRWFAPDGTLLHACDSPWRHGLHPFAVKHYPLIDGEVHPFVEDVIDQQRHVNRLITLIDHVISTSAKGALLFPVQAQVAGVSLQDYANAWARPGAVIPYDTSRTSAVPQAVTSRGDDSGATSLLGIELKMMEQVSGVSTALQGLTAGGDGRTASLYAAQVENAVVALRDVFDTFAGFCRSRDRLAASLRGDG